MMPGGCPISSVPSMSTLSTRRPISASRNRCARRPAAPADTGAGGDLTAREHLGDGQRGPALRQLGQHDALQRLLVLGHDEVAETLAHLGLHRRQLAAYVVEVAAAHGQLRLELRIVGAEAEL